MRIESLVELAKSSLKLGIIVCGVITILYIIGYLLLYRLFLLGENKIHIKKLLWTLIICWYLAIIINITLAGRNSIFVQKIRPLFSSYSEAWYTMSVTDWRNIILNYCLFIPLGVLLPIGIRFFRKLNRVGIVSIILSISIEILQVVTKTGIFELDDILGNTIGALIGFGFYYIVFYIMDRKKNHKTLRFSTVLLMQIPLGIVILSYICLILLYNAKELGNNSYDFYYGYDPEDMTVSAEIEFDNEKRTIPIYKTPILTLNEAREYADEISGGINLKGLSKKEDVFENKIIVRYLENESGDVETGLDLVSEQHISTCTVYYRGAFYDFGINHGLGKKLVVEHTNGVTSTIEVEIINGEALAKEILHEYGKDIPEGYEFSIWKMIKYVYNYNFVPYEGKYLYGELSYNPNNEFVENHVMKCDYVGDYEIISMEEAYSKITKGEFGLKHENIKRVEERLNIEITGCKLVYEADSKGYLQPNYDFYCIINGSVDEIFIPALKK